MVVYVVFCAVFRMKTTVVVCLFITKRWFVFGSLSGKYGFCVVFRMNNMICVWFYIRDVVFVRFFLL